MKHPVLSILFLTVTTSSFAGKEVAIPAEYRKEVAIPAEYRKEVAIPAEYVVNTPYLLGTPRIAKIGDQSVVAVPEEIIPAEFRASNSEKWLSLGKSLFLSPDLQVVEIPDLSDISAGALIVIWPTTT